MLLAITAAVLAAHVIILVPINPALLAEREEGFRAEGTKRWDKWVVAFSATFGTLVLWVLAGLDFRFGWSGSVVLAVHLAGLAAYVAGYAIFLWAMAANAFFAEGGAHPDRAGPYRRDGRPVPCGPASGVRGGDVERTRHPFPARLGAKVRFVLPDATLLRDS